MKTLKNKTNKRKDNRNKNKFNIDKSNHRLIYERMKNLILNYYKVPNFNILQNTYRNLRELLDNRVRNMLFISIKNRLRNNRTIKFPPTMWSTQLY